MFKTIIYKYEHPYLMSEGFPVFDIKHEKYDQLIEETSKMILENLFMIFSTDQKLPKIPKDVLTGIMDKKVKKLIESNLIDRNPYGELMIAPAKLLRKVDTSWKSYLQA